MIIGVDVDSILANFMKTFLRYANEKHGSNITCDDIVNWDWNPEDFNLWAEIEEISKDIDLMSNVEVIPNSQLLNYFWFRHYIKIVTSRLPDAHRVTRYWLDRYFDYDAIVWTHGSKKTAEEIQVDILIDDSTKNIMEFMDSGGWRGIMLEWAWNKNDRDNIQKYIDNGSVTIHKDWNGIIRRLRELEMERREDRVGRRKW